MILTGIVIKIRVFIMKNEHNHEAKYAHVFQKIFDVVCCHADNECIKRMCKMIRMYTFYLTLQKRVEKGHRELSLVW